MEILRREDGHLVARLRCDLEAHPFLRDHLIRGRPVLPGVWALELLTAAAGRLLEAPPRLIVDCTFAKQLELDPPPAELLCEGRRRADGTVEATLYTERVAGRSGAAGAGPRPPGAAATESRTRRRLVHARAILCPSGEAGELPAPPRPPVPLARRSRSEVYQWIPFGPAFHNVQRVELSGSRGATALLRAEQPWPGVHLAGHGLIRDAGFHAACCHHRSVHGGNAIPASLGRLHVLEPARQGVDYVCHILPQEQSEKLSRYRLLFLSSGGALVEVHDDLVMVATRT
jgi:polyketide synthase PksN